MDNSDLRKQAAQAIQNYMHHELFDIAGADMMPFYMEQADEILNIVDRAIKNAKLMALKAGIA
jgi:hypothetical protein